MHVAPSLLALAVLATLGSPIMIRLSHKGERRCFLVRSSFSREQVNFSYVVYSDVYGGNDIEFLLTKEGTNLIISRVAADNTSFQRIFRFDSDKESNYRCCFTSPNDYSKTIRVYIEHTRREDIVSKDNIYGSIKMLGDLREEETRLEENLFLEYMNLKHIDDALTRSQKVLTAAFVLKFVLFLVAAVLQFYGVVKLLAKLSVRITDLV